MTIDLEKALGAELATTEGRWSQDDVILYHLGIGAGAGRATETQELEYTYEKNLKVLPSFGVVPVFDAVMQLNSVPGIDINFAMVLHGEQQLEIHKPLPAKAEVVNTGRIAGIYDKGKAALIVIEAVTTEKGGDKLCTNRFSVFARGEGGFGGESGPKAGNHCPERAPDLVV
ncbi:MAG: MaoC family dehydratase N-terminal domain-containing protein, partial [Myxococcota bacterium]